MFPFSVSAADTSNYFKNFAKTVMGLNFSESYIEQELVMIDIYYDRLQVAFLDFDYYELQVWVNWINRK